MGMVFVLPDVCILTESVSASRWVHQPSVARTHFLHNGHGVTTLPAVSVRT